MEDEYEVKNDTPHITVGDYIKEMGKRSKTKDHEIVQECLDLFGANGTRDLTLEQVKNFCDSRHINVSKNTGW